MSENKHMCSEISRRELLKGAGAFAVGASVLSVAGLMPLGRAEAKQIDVEKLCRTADLKSEAKYPWPYKKVDPELAAEIAYRNWYKGFCAYATVSGILIPLQMEIGDPYTSLPLEAFAFGHGGTVGWGTLCGTLFGAGIAASFTTGKKVDKIINDVMAWYSVTELPTFVPKEPKATFKNVNKSDSPLCHVSVGRWMAKEGVSFDSPQRQDRCARLAASVAAKTVEILNANADGTYKPQHGDHLAMYSITAQNNCMDCHDSGVPPIPGS